MKRVGSPTTATREATMGVSYREYLRTQKKNAGKARVSTNSTARTARQTALARKQSRIPFHTKGKEQGAHYQMRFEER